MTVKARAVLFGIYSLIACQFVTMAATAGTMIVALGDSLTAGYGLPPGQGFAGQLQDALRARGHDVNVIDAGVSGDTTRGGLARLDWSVPADADAVIVELGANDALRGLDPSITRQALGEIVKRLKARGQAVLLAGMRAPPNLGKEYAAEFDAIYGDLAAAEEVLLYPFFLEGVAADPALNQADGIHPSADGVARIVEKILPSVEALIAQSVVAAGGKAD
ncbi:MAG: arylesterase [Alphaproteobacteria bacterium]|nr:MAG: arylesterase [Alphaproteobacteria bacterium]